MLKQSILSRKFCKNWNKKHRTHTIYLIHLKIGSDFIGLRLLEVSVMRSHNLRQYKEPI